MFASHLRMAPTLITQLVLEIMEVRFNKGLTSQDHAIRETERRDRSNPAHPKIRAVRPTPPPPNQERACGHPDASGFDGLNQKRRSCRQRTENDSANRSTSRRSWFFPSRDVEPITKSCSMSLVLKKLLSKFNLELSHDSS